MNYPINIGFEEDISIKELASLIAELAGFDGEIVWNTNKPDGQFRKILDPSRMAEHEIKIKNRTSLRDGLRKTIGWYRKNLK